MNKIILLSIVFFTAVQASATRVYYVNLNESQKSKIKQATFYNMYSCGAEALLSPEYRLVKVSKTSVKDIVRVEFKWIEAFANAYMLASFEYDLIENKALANSLSCESDY